SKKELFCQKWREVAIKFSGSTQRIPAARQTTLTINPDGTFTEELYAISSGEKKFHKGTANGQWKFSSDSMHIGFMHLGLDDNPQDKTAIETFHTSDSLVKLTRDQLIYGIPAFNVSKNAWGYHYHYLARVKN
ncbi:MAG TPA: hypothetical protein VKH37_12805, partial [Ferruginibacter sp.]|nr:hypothetical protein [Ferruginibacter sp.]